MPARGVPPGGLLPSNSVTSWLADMPRARRGQWLGGVCGGIARRIGWPTWLVRLLFAAATPLPLFPGIAVYAVLWVLMPGGD